MGSFAVRAIGECGNSMSENNHFMHEFYRYNIFSMTAKTFVCGNSEKIKKQISALFSQS
jgi:hypothetical protein